MLTDIRFQPIQTCIFHQPESFSCSSTIFCFLWSFFPYCFLLFSLS